MSDHHEECPLTKRTDPVWRAGRAAWYVLADRRGTRQEVQGWDIDLQSAMVEDMGREILKALGLSNSPVIPEGSVEQREWRLMQNDRASTPGIHEGTVRSESEADKWMAEYPDTWKKQYRTPAGPWIDAEVNP